MCHDDNGNNDGKDKDDVSDNKIVGDDGFKCLIMMMVESDDEDDHEFYAEEDDDDNKEGGFL